MARGWPDTKLYVECPFSAFFYLFLVLGWQPRLKLGMVEARSVNNVKNTPTYTYTC